MADCNDSTIDYIRNYYGVPAKRGGRVEFQGKQGVITGAGPGAHLRIRLDGEKIVRCYHPTWELKYLEGK
jgi:hypothetical protein